ncbi:MAG: hypothetical protein CBARDCOR_6494 [uncultured Caballeronia sp.]|nr:MAG: hypothetical protein CBARDCOR_6494 [uncultured Caballeronia sp.]
MAQHLIRRNGGYSYRRRIPADLVQAYKGKTEIVRAWVRQTPKRRAGPLTSWLVSWTTSLNACGTDQSLLPSRERIGALPAEQIDLEEEHKEREHKERLERAVERVLARQAPGAASVETPAGPNMPPAQQPPTKASGIGLPELVRVWEKAKKPRAAAQRECTGLCRGSLRPLGVTRSNQSPVSTC